MKDARGRRLAEARRMQGQFCATSTASCIRFNDLQLPRVISPKYTRFYPSHLENSLEFGHAVHGHADLLAVTGSKLKLYRNTRGFELAQEFDDDLFVACGNTASINANIVAILCFNFSEGNFLCTWNLETEEVLSQIRLAKRTLFLCSIVSLNNGNGNGGNNIIVVGDNEGTMHIVEHDDDGCGLRVQGVVRNEFKEYYDIVAHNNTFAVISDDNSINVWDAVDRVRVAVIPMEEETDFDLNDQYLVCMTGKTLRVYEKELLPISDRTKRRYSYQLSSCYTDCDEIPSNFRRELKLLPNNLLIVGARGDGVLILLDLALKKIIARYKLPFEEVPWIDVSSDARILVSLSSPGESKHAVISITRPRRVVHALQLYAKYRYGTEMVLKPRNRTIHGVITAIAKTGVVCGVVWTCAKFISR